MVRQLLGAMFAGIGVVVLIVSALAVVALGAGAFMLFTGDLPRLETLKKYQPPLVSRVYSRDGRIIGEFFVEKRTWVPYKRIPLSVVHAFVAAEDARFFQHRGIDYLGIVRAAFKNIEAGGIVQGGSTITQQVAKMVLLTPERSFSRKIREIITAIRIERELSKIEILELYLNQIYLGHGAYGVAQGASTYFQKELNQLTLAEVAMLAGLPRAPARYSPLTYPDRAKERQRYVLSRMAAVGYLTEKEANAAFKVPLRVARLDRSSQEAAAYFVEHVRRYVEEKYGTDAVYKSGLTIRTTLDSRLQVVAARAVTEGLRELDKRQGYRGRIERVRVKEIGEFLKDIRAPIRDGPGPKEGQVLKGVVERRDPAGNMAWVRIPGFRGKIDLNEEAWAKRSKAWPPSPGDVIMVMVAGFDPKTKLVTFRLEQEPAVQGALVAIESQTGHILAMVGGGDFQKTQFNRTVQARRQPGSAFKPIIYAAALDAGLTPETVIDDSPVSYPSGIPGQRWSPQNYDREYKGPITVRQALEESRNVVTVKILERIGVDYVINYAKKLGISGPLVRNLSLGLGASEVTLLELTRAYSAFADQGMLSDPVFITEIRDRGGRLIEKNSSRAEQAISPDTSFRMVDLMQGVVQRGTGRSVRALGRPVAGKTGTTDDFADAWFIGFTPQLVAGAWVGFDERATLGYGETGARAAAPIWLKFMSRALSGQPVVAFGPPETREELGELETPKPVPTGSGPPARETDGYPDEVPRSPGGPATFPDSALRPWGN